MHAAICDSGDVMTASVGGVIALCIVAAVIAAFILLMVLGNARRRAAWRSLADSLSLSFSEDVKAVNQRFQFDILSYGLDCRALFLVFGEHRGASVLVGDHEFTKQTERGRPSYRQTFCIVAKPGMSLPGTFLWPESPLAGFGGRLAAKLGVKEAPDIDFEDDPGFSDAFGLSGDDEESTRALYDHESRRLLLDHQGLLKECLLETRGAAVLLMAANKNMAAAVNYTVAGMRPNHPAEAGKRIPPARAVELMELGLNLVREWSGNVRFTSAGSDEEEE